MRRLLAGIAALVAATGAGAAISYDNVTNEVGISFQQAGEVHGDEPGEDLDAAFPEVIGGGVCMADFDGDGLDDLYFVSQQYNPMNEATEGWIDRVDPHNRLYINKADGTFEDRTAEAGVASGAWGYGCSAADYDGDLDIDLFVANFGPSEFFENDGDGTFTNATARSGLAMTGACGEHRCMSTNSAWGDYDLDGDLDLFVGNYVNSSLEDGNHGPQDHVAQANWLFRNNGDGTFTERAREAGVMGRPADEDGSKTFGVMWLDYDRDGDLDLYIANDSEPNELYENLGDGTFADRSVFAGVDDTRASMGLAVGDYDSDGYPDLFFTHYVFQEYGFYRNQHDGTFEDRSGEDGLASAGDNVGWGTAFVDYDRDGDLDLVSVNGHTAFAPDTYAQPTYAWRQDPNADPDADPWDRTWIDVSDELGPGLQERRVGRGAAFGDYDLDGDTDIVTNNNANETADVLRASGVSNHFLNVRLRQDGANRHGLGAHVTLEAGDLVVHRDVEAGSSYLSQNTLTLEFGLGAHAQADRIVVSWLGGGTTVVEDVAADQTVRIDRATGAVVTDVLAPRTTIDAAGTAGVEGWFRSAATATLTSVDLGSPTVSGVSLVELAIDGAPWTAHDGAGIVLDEEGRYELRARATDAAGNVEPARSLFIGVDLTAPTATHDLDGMVGQNGWWVGTPVAVRLSADDALSGVHEIRYHVDGGAWTLYEGAFAIADDGVHTVEYLAEDRAGNVGALASFELAVDLNVPDASIASPKAGSIRVGSVEIARTGRGPVIVLATPGTVVTIDVDAVDEASGVDRVIFIVDGRARFTDHDGLAWSWDWSLDDETTGARDVEVLAIDSAGNVGIVTIDVVVLATPA